MKSFLLILVVSFFSLNLCAQTHEIAIASALAKKSHTKRIDSIARVLKLKSGAQVKVYTIFSVNREGYIVDIRARGTHPLLEKEAIRVLKEVPKMDPLNPGDEIQSYSLPIIFVIETDEEKRQRLKKERKAGI